MTAVCKKIRRDIFFCARAKDDNLKNVGVPALSGPSDGSGQAQGPRQVALDLLQVCSPAQMLYLPQFKSYLADFNSNYVRKGHLQTLKKSTPASVLVSLQFQKVEGPRAGSKRPSRVQDRVHDKSSCRKV